MHSGPIMERTVVWREECFIGSLSSVAGICGYLTWHTLLGFQNGAGTILVMMGKGLDTQCYGSSCTALFRIRI